MGLCRLESTAYKTPPPQIAGGWSLIVRGGDAAMKGSSGQLVHEAAGGGITAYRPRARRPLP